MSNPSLLCVPYRFKTSKLYSQIPDSGLGDFVVTRTTTPTAGQATRVNAAGFIETVADNVPRLDYPLGGITAGCPALLVEPASTNQIRNNSMVGAVAGSPGTMPTNYSTSLAGLTRTIVGTGTENGVVYMDIRFNGTSTGGAVVIQEETSAFITAASGQVWTHSIYAKLIANVSNMPSIRVGMYEYTSGGVYLAEGSTPFTLTSSLNRFSFTRTLANASTARVAPTVQWVVNNGVSYDFTIRIGYPQMEQSSVATSVIPTTTAAITRGAETISKTGISSLIGQTQGTFYLDIAYTLRGASTGNRWLEISGPSNNIGLAVATADVVRSIVNGLSDIFITPSTASGVKIAWGYDGSGVTLFVNGTQYTLTNGGAQVITALDKVLIDMSSTAGSRIASVRIRAVTLYPTRLPNTGPLSLQSLTQ